MKTTGIMIKNLRTSLNLSQEKLAEELGINIKSIQRYETDKHKPDVYTLVKLATYFDVSTDYLLGLLPVEESCKEESSKVFNNGSYNIFYKRYLDCKQNHNVDETTEYYWIYEKNGIMGGQTEWIGYTDETQTLETRKLRPIIATRAIESCTLMYGTPIIINEEEDVLVFRLFGGHAIVKKEICERYLPEFLIL
ncbi:helix-turn-helix transcriptional regulator [Azotosporobacter soli]|uniref:helix-turn-helix domain-containing protein n=1 Tax=Azotosporobacter soli TaxID=3055040 RepID=UPI0031FEB641